MALLALTGAPCTGKSTAADILESGGYPTVRMGETLRAQVDSSDEDEVWEYAEKLREEHGEHGVAVPCVDPLREALQTEPLVAIEGCRTMSEIDYLEQELDTKTIILHFFAPWEDRVRWFSGREGRGGSAEELKKREERERAAGLVEFQVCADAIINNNRTVEDLANEVIDIAWKLTKSDEYVQYSNSSP